MITDDELEMLIFAKLKAVEKFSSLREMIAEIERIAELTDNLKDRLERQPKAGK